MYSLDFSGKTVLVVGGSSGIGNGIAQAFHSCGATVYVWGTRGSAADYSKAEGSNLAHLHYSRVDVGDLDAIESYVNPFNELDVLVLAQGTVIYKRGEFNMAGFKRVIDVNLVSLMACSLKYHDMLAEARGSLITIGSTAAFQATIGNPAYNASKTGVVGLTRTLAAAWAKEGIRVNSIAPGLVETKLTRVTTGNAQRLEAAIGSIPAGRLGTPDDVAGAALYLASPLAMYVIGHTLPVDGGLILA
ncbi:MAG: SDR family oxidoreductase [Pseudomonadota bacterium]|nr:SDR family oxidoreductase [Pseudomonadota bacterium]